MRAPGSTSSKTTRLTHGEVTRPLALPVHPVAVVLVVHFSFGAPVAVRLCAHPVPLPFLPLPVVPLSSESIGTPTSLQPVSIQGDNEWRHKECRVHYILVVKQSKLPMACSVVVFGA